VDAERGLRGRKTGWVWFVAARYIFRRRGKSPSAVLSGLGIAVGVLALIVIIAVMNGFQLGFIESILEVSSYHVRVAAVAPEEAEEAERLLAGLPAVRAVVPFREFQGIARGWFSGQQAALVRGLPEDTMTRDPAFAEQIEFGSGGFDLSGENNALLGVALADRMGVRLGDTFTLFSIPSIFAPADPEGGDSGTRNFVVSGIFRTGFPEYDLGWMFIRIDRAEFFSEGAPVLGVKIADRFRDAQVLARARSAWTEAGLAPAEFSSWRDYNRAFFGALRTEKLFMFILVGLIFIVVGLNIFQSQRRMLLERREELALLRAVGSGDLAVRMIVVLDGAIVGFAGSVLGLASGLFLALNVSGFFRVLEAAVNGVIDLVNLVSGIFAPGDGIGEFAIFPQQVFYLVEITSRVIPAEAALIFGFGFLSSLLAAWFASGPVSRRQPAEVLRYE